MRSSRRSPENQGITPQHSSSISVARNDFAALLSLVEGASFSLQSKDAAAQKLVMDKLQGSHDKDYADWLADANAIAKLQANPLASAQDKTNLGMDLNFTDTYLSDRSAFLNWRAQARYGQPQYIGTQKPTGSTVPLD